MENQRVVKRVSKTADDAIANLTPLEARRAIILPSVTPRPPGSKLIMPRRPEEYAI